MMKSIFIFAGLIFLFGTTFATPIKGYEEFSDWSDFNGMFGKIYNDIQEIDITEICERVLEWPDFLDEEGELIFSLEDCEEFVEDGILSSFVNSHAGSKTNIDRWIEVFRSKYEFEKELWRKEYDLQRKMALSSIWNDGDGGGLPPKKRTSPVDLVLRWNEIDKILFGVIAEQPEFESFIESEDDIFDPWSETPEEDIWIDQRANNLIPYGIAQNHYSEGEKSIVGGYAEQAKMFEEDLNAHSLIAGKATTQSFDMAFTGAPIPTSTGMHVDADASIAESPDVPEQITVLEQVPMGELEGVFAKFFQQQSSSELRDAQDDGSRTGWFYKIFVEVPEQTNEEFLENIAHLLRVRSERRMQDTGLSELIPLTQFNTTLDIWIKILDKWKDVNGEFLKNVAK